MSFIQSAAERLTFLEALAADSYAATANGNDIELAPYKGKASFLLSAEAAGGGTATVSLQHADLTAGTVNFQLAGATANAVPLKIGASDNVALAQQFTQSGAAGVKFAYLRLRKQGTIAAGKKLTLAIMADDSGDPHASTTLGTFATVDIDSEVSTDWQWIKFTAAKAIMLADSTAYHYKLTADYTASADNNVEWSASTVASGGGSEIEDAAWADVATKNHDIYTQELAYAAFSPAKAFTAVTTAASSFQELLLDTREAKQYVRAINTIATGPCVLSCLFAGLK